MGIFGGSSSKSDSQNSSQQQSTNVSNSSSYSGNQAYPWLKEQYSGAVGAGNKAIDLVQSMLTGNNPTAFNSYKQSTGYQDSLDQGIKSATTSAATKGLLGSGSTLKALAKFANNLSQNYFGNYVQQLLGLGQQGLSAGGLISGAGGASGSQSHSEGQSTGTSTGTSTSTAKQNPNLTSLFAAGLGAI